MYCPKCACVNEDTADYCKGCGKDIRTYTTKHTSASVTVSCSMCGEETLKSERLCKKCGAIINENINSFENNISDTSKVTVSIKSSTKCKSPNSAMYSLVAGVIVGLTCGIVILLTIFKIDFGSIKNIVRLTVFVMSGAALQYWIKSIYGNLTVKTVLTGFVGALAGFISSLITIVVFAESIFR